jgi:hypothetical protein
LFFDLPKPSKQLKGKGTKGKRKRGILSTYLSSFFGLPNSREGTQGARKKAT